MEVKDYNNIVAVLVGAAIILACIFVYYLAQLYFRGCSNQVKKVDDNKSNKSVP